MAPLTRLSIAAYSHTPHSSTSQQKLAAMLNSMTYDRKKLADFVCQ